MIVCLCHRISDRDIRAAVDEGVRCFEQLQDETLTASSCGCCLECAQEVFEHALAQAADQPASGPKPVIRLSVAAA